MKETLEQEEVQETVIDILLEEEQDDKVTSQTLSDEDAGLHSNDDEVRRDALEREFDIQLQRHSMMVA